MMWTIHNFVGSRASCHNEVSGPGASSRCHNGYTKNIEPSSIIPFVHLNLMEGALVNAYKLRSASNVGVVVVSWQLLYQKTTKKPAGWRDERNKLSTLRWVIHPFNVAHLAITIWEIWWKTTSNHQIIKDMMHLCVNTLKVLNQTSPKSVTRLKVDMRPRSKALSAMRRGIHGHRNLPPILLTSQKH